jgi:predicted DNA-binding transcriptional regulator AlpA
MQTNSTAVQGLLRLPQVLKLIPMSRSSWWAGGKEGRFPRPIKLGRRMSVWRAQDIQAFLASLSGGK